MSEHHNPSSQTRDSKEIEEIHLLAWHFRWVDSAEQMNIKGGDEERDFVVLPCMIQVVCSLPVTGGHPE